MMLLLLSFCDKQSHSCICCDWLRMCCYVWLVHSLGVHVCRCPMWLFLWLYTLCVIAICAAFLHTCELCVWFSVCFMCYYVFWVWCVYMLYIDVMLFLWLSSVVVFLWLCICVVALCAPLLYGFICMYMTVFDFCTVHVEHSCCFIVWVVLCVCSVCECPTCFMLHSCIFN